MMVEIMTHITNLKTFRTKIALARTVKFLMYLQFCSTIDTEHLFMLGFNFQHPIYKDVPPQECEQWRTGAGLFY